MIAAGVACLVHPLVPALFVRTASTMVLRLHDEMDAAPRHRPRLGLKPQLRVIEGGNSRNLDDSR